MIEQTSSAEESLEGRCQGLLSRLRETYEDPLGHADAQDGVSVGQTEGAVRDCDQLRIELATLVMPLAAAAANKDCFRFARSPVVDHADYVSEAYCTVVRIIDRCVTEPPAHFVAYLRTCINADLARFHARIIYGVLPSSWSAVQRMISAAITRGEVSPEHTVADIQAVLLASVDSRGRRALVKSGVLRAIAELPHLQARMRPTINVEPALLETASPSAPSAEDAMIAAEAQAGYQVLIQLAAQAPRKTRSQFLRSPLARYAYLAGPFPIDVITATDWSAALTGQSLTATTVSGLGIPTAETMDV